MKASCEEAVLLFYDEKGAKEISRPGIDYPTWSNEDYSLQRERYLRVGGPDAEKMRKVPAS